MSREAMLYLTAATEFGLAMTRLLDGDHPTPEQLAEAATILAAAAEALNDIRQGTTPEPDDYPEAA